jgi:cytochrome c oxidase subunit 2
MAWTIIPTIIFFTFFGWGAVLYTKAVHPPADAMEIFVIGKQWMWKAQYPTGQRVIIGGNPRNMTQAERESIGKLVLPKGRAVRLTMTSEDVIHDFGVPAFRQKIDVLPGRYVRTWYNPTRPGRYHLFCNQYCGTGHADMVGWVVVMRPDEHAAWLRERPDHSAALEGRKLFLKLQCISCHRPDAEARAPLLEGLYGGRVPLKGGASAVADAEYIRESILFPPRQVVEGYEPIMPTFQGRVTEEEVLQLIAFIRSLGRGDQPLPNNASPPPVGAPSESPGQKSEGAKP